MLGLGFKLNLTMQHDKGEPDCIKHVVEINPWKTSSQFDFVYETRQHDHVHDVFMWNWF
jgi:hypothetical protein